MDPEKLEGICEEKKIKRKSSGKKIKNIFKVHKLFLYFI